MTYSTLVLQTQSKASRNRIDGCIWCVACTLELHQLRARRRAIEHPAIKHSTGRLLHKWAQYQVHCSGILVFHFWRSVACLSRMRPTWWQWHQNKHATIAIKLEITHWDRHYLVVYKPCSSVKLQAIRWLIPTIARGLDEHHSFPLFKTGAADWSCIFHVSILAPCDSDFATPQQITCENMLWACGPWGSNSGSWCGRVIPRKLREKMARSLECN